MERTDYHSAVRRAAQASGPWKDRDDGLMSFRCIRHKPDKNPSAWLGKWKWGCWVCAFEESIDTLAEHFGVEKPARDYRIEDYADQKGFTLDLLQKWGVHTTQSKFGDVVAIPYMDAEGKTLRVKLRGRKKSWWGDGSGTYLYGLHILSKAKPTDPVILVEGESDCHAAWHHGVLAIGIPGAKGWKPDWAKLLQGRELYIWQEPDEAGAALVASVVATIPNVKVIRVEAA